MMTIIGHDPETLTTRCQKFPLFDAMLAAQGVILSLKKINLLLAPSGDHPSTALLLLLAGVTC